MKLRSPSCPYCGVIQDPPPQRKRKCRDCGQPIYVKKLEDGYRHLLTEHDVKEREHQQREKQWKELSAQVQTALQAGDWGVASQAYRGQAEILFKEGRPHHHVAQQARRCELMRMKEAGIKKVEISTCKDGRVCPECQALEGKVFSIETALEKMPLPGRQCEDKSVKNPHGGRCRCIYLAVI